MSPASQLYGRTFLGAGPGSRLLALTYDDGPNDPHTLRLLEVLARHGARATFFLIGRFARERPDIVREVARGGHAIGNHTYSHPLLIFASPARLREELDGCRKAIEDAAGEQAPLFRPPFGGRRPATLAEVRRRGWTTVMWTASAYDWKVRSAEEVERKVVSEVRGGDVILMHDGAHVRLGASRAHTVEATDRLLVRYKAADYEFVTVPEMMQAVSYQPSAVS